MIKFKQLFECLNCWCEIVWYGLKLTYYIVLTSVDAGKTSWRDPTRSLNIYLKLFYILCCEYGYSMMSYIGILNVMIWLDIFGYNELPKIYKLNFGKKVKEVNS